jgi:hypothetical protein
MIRGYFEDMHQTFVACKQLMKPGGHMAFVVGNVQHAGVHVPVDEILAKLGEQAGLKWKETWLIRLRGNSAQQMGRHGRQPSRESENSQSLNFACAVIYRVNRTAGVSPCLSS